MDFTPLKNFMDRLTSWRIPGNSISICIENKEVFNYSSGYADVENKIPMDSDKLVNIYSCSKPSTVIGALRLYEQGYFLLDDPVYDFLPEFGDICVETENGIVQADKPLTMRHLFTMTSGISYEHSKEAISKIVAETNGNPTTRDFAKCIASFPLHFHPGETWQYGVSHDILGAVIEVISGMKFRDYMTKNIFDPLGMTTTLYHNESVQDKMAEQYRFESLSNETNIVKLQASGDGGMGGVLKNIGKSHVSSVYPELEFGGSSIVTSVNDYSKFVSALANGGVGATGERIIASSTIELLRTNQLTPKQRETMSWPQLKGYGYGLGVRTLIDKAASGSTGPVGEFGWGGAAGATVLVDPDSKISLFYAHHMLNPQEDYYQPRLRNVLYTCING